MQPEPLSPPTADHSQVTSQASFTQCACGVKHNENHTVALKLISFCAPNHLHCGEIIGIIITKQ